MRIVLTEAFIKTLEQKSDFRSKVKKTLDLFVQNARHPSLRSKKLKPKILGICSIRLNKQYRLLFTIKDGKAYFLEISKHYEK
jgi:plasmid maintenance system killer protein